MGLLTIGAFASAARLSPKSLRLYDELGLLPPAAVDPASGYRYYAPDQLERARLVAWLRRLGMPLARIREVCDAEPADAAKAVAAYWARVTADTAERGRLAGFLVDHLSGRGTTMSDTHTLGLRYASRTDTGLVRTSNQDTAYAGARLLAVADGAAPGGDRASAAAVEALRTLEDADVPADGLLAALTDAAEQADRAVRDVAAHDETAVSTLTALVWSGSQLGLVHVGDSRAYLLRDGALFRITVDHTYVQSLVEEGRLTAAEAESHPDRALLVRALGSPERGHADVSLRTAAAGDRYLLCSDGLSAVVAEDALRDALTAGAGPEETVQRLVGLAHEAGAPDNVACVVADVVEL